MELSDRELKIGYWWVLHRGQLRKWWGVALLVGDILIFGIFIIQTLVFIREMMHTERYFAEIAVQNTSYTSARARLKPEGLLTDTVYTFPSNAENSVDAAVKITNPNASWAVESFQYSFIVQGKLMPPKKGFLLPDQTSYLADLALPVSGDINSEAKTTSAALNISDIQWKRVHKENLPEIEFAFNNLKHELKRVENTDNRSEVFSNVSADIVNMSVYGFWKTDMVVLLLIDEQVVAARNITLENFRTEESKHIEAQWNRIISRGARPEIVPIVDVLHDENLIGLLNE